MKRFLLVAAVTVIFLGAASAGVPSRTGVIGAGVAAASPEAIVVADDEAPRKKEKKGLRPSDNGPPHPDYAAQCKSLAGQWASADAANTANANLGKARREARLAAADCAMTAEDKQKTGVSDYAAALKLLGVTPS